MEKPVVRLDIPSRWMLWKIYQAKEDEDQFKDEGWDINVCWAGWKEAYIHYGDPVDEDDFDGGALFPSIKPDRDLFGAPRRCRKQRGWYYVKRWPPVPQTVNGVQDTYATGADIPPELFDDMINYERWSEKDLGLLRLVCRHWEKLCLSRMFYRDTLRHHGDVTDRLALLSTRLAWGWTTYPIRRIHLIMALKTAATWRPRVNLSKLLSRLSPGVQRTELEISGPIPPGRRLTSVHLSSPRRTPWHPLPIQLLKLYDLHFKKIDDLIQVLRELPYLEEVSGQDITWGASMEVHPRMTSFVPCPNPHPDLGCEFIMITCPPGLAGMLVCALAPFGTGTIAQADAAVLHGLLLTLGTPGSHSETTPVIVPRQASRRFAYGLFIENGHRLPSIQIGLAAPSARAGSRAVQFIVLEIGSIQSGYLREGWMRTVPWDSVVDALGLLTTQPSTVLIFGSPEAAVSFWKYVGITNMARLHALGKLKYVVEDKEEQALSLVGFDADRGWRVLANSRYNDLDLKDRYDSDLPGSRAHALWKIVA